VRCIFNAFSTSCIPCSLYSSSASLRFPSLPGSRIPPDAPPTSRKNSSTAMRPSLPARRRTMSKRPSRGSWAGTATGRSSTGSGLPLSSLTTYFMSFPTRSFRSTTMCPLVAMSWSLEESLDTNLSGIPACLSTSRFTTSVPSGPACSRIQASTACVATLGMFKTPLTCSPSRGFPHYQSRILLRGGRPSPSPCGHAA
jgi:hypothetical protein